MGWALRIGRLAGIDVYVHHTFTLFLVAVFLLRVHQGQSVVGALASLGFILALFGCVVLHELGHALAARQFGIRTRDITLLPIGGVARLERMPTKPAQELWVAAAGPLINVIIAAALVAGLLITGRVLHVHPSDPTQGDILSQLIAANVFLVVFNLIPAFPMDGGRMFRALLATVLPYARATQIAAVLGQAIALVFAFVGLMTHYYMLLFIALFVWIGAGQEAGAAQVRSALWRIPVRDAMLTDYRLLLASETLGRAVDLILSGSQQDFPVVEDARVVGVLPKQDLIAGLARLGPNGAVAQVMRSDFLAAAPEELLEEAVVRLQGSPCPIMPVLAEGRIVGMLTLENVTEYLMIQSALGKARGAPQAARSARNTVA